MDIVYIQGLQVRTVIGVYDWEREIEQTLSFDLELATDVRAAAATDAIEQALDYAAISARISTYVQASRYQLIETLAERVAELLRASWGCRASAANGSSVCGGAGLPEPGQQCRRAGESAQQPRRAAAALS